VSRALVTCVRSLSTPMSENRCSGISLARPALITTPHPFLLMDSHRLAADNQPYSPHEWAPATPTGSTIACCSRNVRARRPACNSQWSTEGLTYALNAAPRQQARRGRSSRCALFRDLSLEGFARMERPGSNGL